MIFHSYRSQTHPVHKDIQPIVSAFKHGNKRIAKERFHRLCDKNNVARWEALVISNLVREACKKENIAM